MLTSRQRAIRRIGWLLLFLLFVRGVFDAIRYETGPETIEQHLFDCSFGWLGRNQDRLFALPVTQRADFWEREVLRRPSDEVETGVSTMRRARLIDKIVELEHALDPSRVDLPEPLPIDDRLHIECVRLALRATELTPDDPEVWRDAALLCAHSARRSRLPSLAGFTFDELLKRASAHDSGNGLYQILEAVGESIADDMRRNWGNLRSSPMTFPVGSDTSRTLLLQGLAQPQLAGGERLELDGIHLAVRLPISRSDQVNLAMGMRWPWRFTALVKVLTQRLCEEGASEPEVNLNRSQSRARRTLQLRRLTEQLCSAGDRSLKMSILFDATLARVRRQAFESQSSDRDDPPADFLAATHARATETQLRERARLHAFGIQEIQDADLRETRFQFDRWFLYRWLWGAAGLVLMGGFIDRLAKFSRTAHEECGPGRNWIFLFLSTAAGWLLAQAAVRQAAPGLWVSDYSTSIQIEAAWALMGCSLLMYTLLFVWLLRRVWQAGWNRGLLTVFILAIGIIVGVEMLRLFRSEQDHLTRFVHDHPIDVVRPLAPRYSISHGRILSTMVTGPRFRHASQSASLFWNPGAQRANSAAIPLGLGMTAGILFVGRLLCTPGRTGRSLFDWLWASSWNYRKSASTACLWRQSSWFARVTVGIGRDFLGLGVCCLGVYLVLVPSSLADKEREYIHVVRWTIHPELREQALQPMIDALLQSAHHEVLRDNIESGDAAFDP